MHTYKLELSSIYDTFSSGTSLWHIKEFNPLRLIRPTMKIQTTFVLYYICPVFVCPSRGKL